MYKRQGVNDIFNVVTDFEMIEWELKIFNRWGEMVHKSDMIENGWDGTYKGVVCPDGIYTYVFIYKSCANPYTAEQKSGFVNLIR